MSVLWDPNHPKCYNKLHKDDAWEDIAKAMRTVSGEYKKKVTGLLLSSEEREEDYGKAVVQEKVCMYVCPVVIVTNRNVTSIPKLHIFLGWFYFPTTEVRLCKISELEISNHNKISNLKKMHFAGADETYENMWYSSLVDRDKHRETVSRGSMNFMYACHKMRPSIWHYCAISSLTSLAYAECFRGKSVMGIMCFSFP